MSEMFAQGDLLIERVADVEPCGTVMAPEAAGVCVLAEGELTGHRHATYGRVTMFRDDSLAAEIPTGLYVGHVRVEGGSASIHHQEHAPIALSEGTYPRASSLRPYPLSPCRDDGIPQVGRAWLARLRTVRLVA